MATSKRKAKTKRPATIKLPDMKSQIMIEIMRDLLSHDTPKGYDKTPGEHDRYGKALVMQNMLQDLIDK